ncbi:hypothetical protein EG028_07375 [Chitinophaga barathri]|uniref:Uncharacterized protein n=2 Tax=Chitinophaga barathri TaxID=1647451 RepID=A0A3N4MPG1_9BACT|nr:hypothetical protein EG028_07375 [Chitinophaga barathri]
MDNSNTEDLLNGPGLEEPAIRKDLIPSWMSKLLLVLIFYKLYSILRSVQFYLVVWKNSLAVPESQTVSLIVFVLLDLLEAFVFIGLLRQWKPAAPAGIVVLCLSVLSVLLYFARFLFFYGSAEYNTPAGLIIQSLITLASLAILITILIRLFKIRRAWVKGVAGK